MLGELTGLQPLTASLFETFRRGKTQPMSPLFRIGRHHALGRRRGAV
jgi:hypothetical protein